MMWSFYRKDTGVFTGQRFNGPRIHEGNIPEGCGAFEGEVDHRRKRLDALSGELIDFTSPDEAEWIVQSRQIASEMAEIEVLERLQVRSISELFDDPNSKEARENFDRRKARITELRQKVTSGKETISRGG